MDYQVKIDVPIKELYKQSKNINFNPAYQRAYIAKDNLKWQQSLINNIIANRSIIPPIYARVSAEIMEFQIENPNKVDDKLALDIIKYLQEMIDGQQRTLTIRDFMDDKFKLDICRVNESKLVGSRIVTTERSLDAMKYSQIKSQFPEIAERFENHLFTIVCNYSEDEEKIHQMFLALNDLNNMTAQEKRNAINSKIAEYVRNTARLEPHTLFSMENNSKGTYINMTFKKMVQDEALAKIFAIVDGTAFSEGISKSALDDMYKNQDYKVVIKNNIDNKVNKVIDTLYTILEDKSEYTKMNLGVLLNLSMVVNYVISDKTLKITDWSDFGTWFFNKHKELSTLSQAEKAAGLEETNYHLKTRLGSTANDLKVYRLKPFIDSLKQIVS